MKPVREINDWLLTEELARQDSAAAVLFYGTESHRSGLVDRSFRSVAQEYQGVVRFFRFNVDENPSAAKERSITVVPVIVLYAVGKEVVRRAGPMTRADIAALIVGNAKNM